MHQVEVIESLCHLYVGGYRGAAYVGDDLGPEPIGLWIDVINPVVEPLILQPDSIDHP